MLRQLMLHIQVELLHVGPAALGGNGVEAQRKRLDRSSARSDVRVAGNVGLRRVQHKRRRGFERLNVLLVTVAMLKEDAVSSPHSPFAIPFGIPRKTEAGGRIEQVSLHATRRHS